VAGWLFSINAGKVRRELRAKLALYQRECADVLADHFVGRRGDNSATESALVALQSGMRTITDRLSAMEDRFQAAEQTRGVLSDWQLERIKRDVHELAMARVQLGWNRSVASATTWIQNRIAAWSHFGGTGASRENMSDERYERVLMCLAQVEKDIQDERSRRGEGRKQVRTLKRGLQRNLFDPQPDEMERTRDSPLNKKSDGEGGLH